MGPFERYSTFLWSKAGNLGDDMQQQKGAHRSNNEVVPMIEYDDFLPGPHPDYEAIDVVRLCMDQLINGKDGAGLEVCFAFSSDRCRAAIGGSLEEFRQYATNPVFSFLVNCDDWSVASIGPVISGTATRGAMQTVLMDATRASVEEKDQKHRQTASNEGSRRFLWTLQKERRPPHQNCWMINEVLYVKNAFERTV